MYRISRAHKFSTVVAQATMNRPFPIRGRACPDDHFRFLVPQPGHVSKNTLRGMRINESRYCVQGLDGNAINALLYST